MSRKLRIYLAATFVILTAVLLIWFKLSQPRILVLHSYGVDYAWARDISTELRRVLEPKLRYQLHWHYMDTKNHPGPEHMRRAAAVARRAIESIKPDVIIAVDDDAQEYVVKAFVDHPGISIVFAGINGEIEPYGYHKARNATGILERKPFADLRDALAAMRLAHGGPIGTRVLHLGDRSTSVLVDTVELESLEWAPLKLVGTRLADTEEEWRRVVEAAASEADVLLVSNYHNLYRDASRTTLVPPEQIVRWTETHSRIPIVGIGGFFVEDGGMFAVGASGFEQGNAAGRMTIRILDEEAQPGSIPIVHPKQFIVYMRRGLLEKRGISLPRLYESFARATNNYLE